MELDLSELILTTSLLDFLHEFDSPIVVQFIDILSEVFHLLLVVIQVIKTFLLLLG